MKIDDRVSNYMSILLGDSAKTSSIAKEKATPGTTTDSVTISSYAAQLVDDEARHERLIAIRRQLSEGTYNISGKDVADKIIKVLKG